MKMEKEYFKISDIIELYKNNLLQVNPEYQRGAVWTQTQKQKLIDSVLRGYPIPLIYLHYIKKNVAGIERENFDIIDGQQRIGALYEFSEGAYSLLDPQSDNQRARFPDFLKKEPCPWANRTFERLSDDWKETLLNTSLSIAKIYTENDNEVRDLFIRLQAGSALNAQETRDAWPGSFTDFILRIGGKPQIARYPGHPFFSEIMRMRPRSDRGKTRALAAQIAMLFIMRKRHGIDFFTDINARSIDDFYYQNIDFDQESSEARRLIEILNKIHSLLKTRNGPALRNHEAIHLVLTVDTLWDDYTRSWEKKLPEALDKFAYNFSAAKKDESPNDFWYNYGQWTRVNSDKAENIKRRHEFYLQKILGYLWPLQLKDTTRFFGPAERELIYFRDSKRCNICQAEVRWEESEIHHVEPHHNGGLTSLENGVLVHRHCHPR